MPPLAWRLQTSLSSISNDLRLWMKRGRLPLTALRTFEVAGRLESFTLAAQELFISQAAVSRQIRESGDVAGRGALRAPPSRRPSDRFGQQTAGDLDVILRPDRPMPGRNPQPTGDGGGDDQRGTFLRGVLARFPPDTWSSRPMRTRHSDRVLGSLAISARIASGETRFPCRSRPFADSSASKLTYDFASEAEKPTSF